MILLENLDILFQLFSLGKPKYFTPMSKNFHSVEVCHLLLLDHLRFEVIPAHLHQLGFLVQILHSFVLVADADLHMSLVAIVGGSTLHVFS